MNTFQITAPGYRLDRAGPDCWRVVSPSGASYIVHPEAGTCTCPDSRARGRRRSCKHVKALWSLLRLCPGLDATCPATSAGSWW